MFLALYVLSLHIGTKILFAFYNVSKLIKFEALVKSYIYFKEMMFGSAIFNARIFIKV